MKRCIRPIAIGLSPNTEKEDVTGAIRTLLSPLAWNDTRAVEEVKDWFRKYTGSNNIFLFNSARSSLYVLLTACGIQKGDEVIVQAFTCVAVPNAVLWTGATPVYADIDARFNMSPLDVKKKITPKTKAIIVQHTFGIPAQIEEIKIICASHHILLIEDCAHSLGATYKGKKVGTWGDASFYSFGRDKVVSSVFGGALSIQNSKIISVSDVQHIYDTLLVPNIFWVLQQLFHPIAMAGILPFYTHGFGKVFLYIFQKLRLLSLPVEKCEIEGRKPEIHPSRYPGALARLLLLQLKKLDRYNGTRRNHADEYFKKLRHIPGLTLPPNIRGAIWHRFPVLMEEPTNILQLARKQDMIFGNWYHHVIDPKGVDFHAINFIEKSAPNAVKTSQMIVNIPTYPLLTYSDRERIITFFEKYSNA